MKQFSPILLLCIFWLANSCQKEIRCAQCAEANKPPVANAGSEQTITLPKDSVQLDGSKSMDPDGTIAAYSWRQIEGPSQASLSNPNHVMVRANRLQVGLYQFELTITYNKGAWARDTVLVTVLASSSGNLAINRPPKACAGEDQVIYLSNNSVTLNGNCSSDTDNNIASYSWMIISGQPGINITTPKASQTAVTNLISLFY